MGTSTSFTELAAELPSASATSKQSHPTNEVLIEIAHEQVEFDGSLVKHERTVRTPDEFTKIRVHTTFTGTSGQRVSPEYLAVMRRRKAKKIAVIVRGLKDRSDDPNFSVFAHEALAEIRSFDKYLAEQETERDDLHEENSREVLRQIRDTLMLRGWERYRESVVCDEVVKILLHLADAEEVTAKFADNSMDRLLDLDLEPALGPEHFVYEQAGHEIQATN